MGEIYDVMVSFFKDDEWPIAELPERPIVQTGFNGDNGQWNCYAQAREEQSQFVFYSVCPLRAPEDKRQAAAEFITRANYGLIIGNFELDFEDGEIRYKTSIDVENDRLTPALIQHLVYANVLTMDRYLPGIITVIYGGVDPDKAVDQIEGPEAG